MGVKVFATAAADDMDEEKNDWSAGDGPFPAKMKGGQNFKFPAKTFRYCYDLHISRIHVHR